MLTSFYIISYTIIILGFVSEINILFNKLIKLSHNFHNEAEVYGLASTLYADS